MSDPKIKVESLRQIVREELLEAWGDARSGDDLLKDAVFSSSRAFQKIIDERTRAWEMMHDLHAQHSHPEWEAYAEKQVRRLRDDVRSLIEMHVSDWERTTVDQHQVEE